MIQPRMKQQILSAPHPLINICFNENNSLIALPENPDLEKDDKTDEGENSATPLHYRVAILA